MHQFERDGEYLFFDPVGFRWFRTDRLGKAVMDGLMRGGTEEGAAEEVATVAAAPLEAARVYTRKALDRCSTSASCNGSATRRSRRATDSPSIPTSSTCT